MGIGTSAGEANRNPKIIHLLGFSCGPMFYQIPNEFPRPVIAFRRFILR